MSFSETPGLPTEQYLQGKEDGSNPSVATTSSSSDRGERTALGREERFNSALLDHRGTAPHAGKQTNVIPLLFERNVRMITSQIHS